MAGTILGVANTQQHDINGQPLVSCLLTIYQGGSTSALANVYQDIGLVIPAPNPLVGDAAGRIPMFFLADGSYGVRLTDQNGIQSNGGFFYPQVPSIGASSSGGGGSVVDPTTVFSTGDVKWRLEESTIAGWVRVNGRTIGNASSGGSERANADTQALFVYIWSTYADAICPVVGGRGASALADFNANKQITLLDARDRTIVGLDDMGNAALNGLGLAVFTKGNATTGGASGGEPAHTLIAAEIPSITSTGSISVNSTSSNVITGTTTTTLTSGGSGANFQGITNGSGASGTLTSTGTANVSSNNTLGGAHNNMPPFLLGTLFWKL